MLENETLADQQNSLRNLNLMGSSFVGDRASYRANMSPTAVRDTPAQRRSQNPAAQSLAGLSDEQMGKHHEEPRSAAKVRDGGAGLMSQSIELANQATYQSQITSGEAQLGNNKAHLSKLGRRMLKKPVSNMTNRNPAGLGGRISVGKPTGQQVIQTKASAPVRNSPLICLS